MAQSAATTLEYPTKMLDTHDSGSGNGGGDKQQPPSGSGEAQDNSNGQNTLSNDNKGNGNKSKGGSGSHPSIPPIGADFRHCQIVYDNDGRLRFNGTWTLESTQDRGGFTRTSHTTTVAGSQASIAFNGTSVTVYGTVRNSSLSGSFTLTTAAANYAIDLGTPNEYEAELPLPISSKDIPNQAFFESPVLMPGTHQMTINVTTDGIPYTINKLWICTKPTDPTAALLQSPGDDNKKTLSAGAIAGITIACISFVLLVILGCILLHRKCRRMRSARTADSPVTKWLERRLPTTLFTSSTSIMRATPSDLETLPPRSSTDLSDLEKSDSGGRHTIRSPSRLAMNGHDQSVSERNGNVPWQFLPFSAGDPQAQGHLSP
ncbi:hypothetical protein BDW22DRAFT_1432847 [Trametopsis cervina]|nr:hypothetical protein BDW22DRAFT_1432847 [Trametopsis cervina]